MSRTGSYLAEQRRARHLNSHEFARALGYTNVVEGAPRILALERDGVTVPGLLDKIVAVLKLDPDHVHALVAEDRRDFQEAWERWANEPVAPELRVRMIPAVWGRESLPSGLTREEAIAYASSRAVERQQTYVRIPSRREEIWCYPTGRHVVRPMNLGNIAGPFTRLRGRGERGFVFA
jgi:hypothetical protein